MESAQVMPAQDNQADVVRVTSRVTAATQDNLRSSQTQSSLSTQLTSNPVLRNLTPAAREALTPTTSFGTTSPLTRVATLYDQTVAPSLSHALTGINSSLDASEYARQFRRLVNQEHLPEVFESFREQVQTDFEHRFAGTLTQEQISAATNVYVHTVLETQLDSITSVGNQEGRNNNSQAVRTLTALLEATFEGVNQVGCSDLATNEQRERYMSRMLEGTSQEVQMDALRAAAYLGFSAVSLFAVASNLHLPNAAQQAIQGDILQHSHDLLSQMQQLIQRSTQSQDPTEREDYDRQLGQIEHDLGSTARWSPVAEAHKLTLAGRVPEAQQVLDDHIELLARIHTGKLDAVTLSRAPISEQRLA